jgi:hypothetical protein
MHPWRLPGSAWLDPRWNQALDLAGSLPLAVSPSELAAAWGELGPEQVLGTLRALASASGQTDAATGTDG